MEPIYQKSKQDDCLISVDKLYEDEQNHQQDNQFAIIKHKIEYSKIVEEFNDDCSVNLKHLKIQQQKLPD